MLLLRAQVREACAERLGLGAESAAVVGAAVTGAVAALGTQPIEKKLVMDAMLEVASEVDDRKIGSERWRSLPFRSVPFRSV